MVLRGLRLGAGRPKICVPVMAGTAAALTRGIAAAKSAGAELVEWRADYCGESAGDDGLFRQLRAAAGETPLLFTFRTKEEGGECALPQERYLALLARAAGSGCFDLLDVELMACGGAIAGAVAAAQKKGVRVVVSSHDFHGTPPLDVMLERLHRMRQAGADIPKLAVMPHSAADVLALLQATEQFSREADCPVITMAMGALGRISRIAGEMFGSAVTFGAVGGCSAPGQLDVASLRTVLDLLHDGQQA